MGWVKRNLGILIALTVLGVLSPLIILAIAGVGGWPAGFFAGLVWFAGAAIGLTVGDLVREALLERRRMRDD